MKWTYLGLAASLQLGLSGLALATFDGSGIGSLGDLLAARAEPDGVGFSRPLDRRQNAGRCGSDGGGAVCPGNQCCSTFGYCGDGDTFCAQIAGCQSAFGWCEGEPLPSPTSSAAPTSSTPSSTSTSTSPTTTPTSSSTSVSSAPTPTSTSPPYTGPLQISQNGMCGNTTTCAGSRFGRCCSQFYYCGSEDSFCGGGCQSQFGSCGIGGGAVSTVTVTSTVTSTITVSVSGTVPAITTQTVTSIISSILTTTVTGTTIGPTSSSTSSTPVITTPTTTSSTSSTTTSSTPSVSIPAGLRTTTDGTCGNGLTCLGSTGGQCCSQWGFCGDERQFCVAILGCQAQFGRCDSS